MKNNLFLFFITPKWGYKIRKTGIYILKGGYKYTDSELLAGLKGHNNEIINYIVKENFKQIKQLVLINNGSENDAQDVFQETLIVVYRKALEDSFELTSTLSTFIYGIARLIWLKEISKRSKNKVLHEDFEYIDIEYDNIQESINKSERLQLFREKFNELSEDCRKVLRMFLLEIPIKEITKLMGYSSEQHTRNRRYRCKEALIKRIYESKKFYELGYEKHPVN